MGISDEQMAHRRALAVAAGQLARLADDPAAGLDPIVDEMGVIERAVAELLGIRSAGAVTPIAGSAPSDGEPVDGLGRAWTEWTSTGVLDAEGISR